MTIGGLDHINIETTNLEASISFYEQILELKIGWRPDFDVPGAWLYVDEHPIIHLVERETVNEGKTGAIHHVALKASNQEVFEKRLNDAGIDYKLMIVPDLSVTQLFISDPNDVILELNFYADSKSK